MRSFTKLPVESLVADCCAIRTYETNTIVAEPRLGPITSYQYLGR
jgi:hypothetical protein